MDFMQNVFYNSIGNIWGRAQTEEVYHEPWNVDQAQFSLAQSHLAVTLPFMLLLHTSWGTPKVRIGRAALMQ